MRADIVDRGDEKTWVDYDQTIHGYRPFGDYMLWDGNTPFLQIQLPDGQVSELFSEKAVQLPQVPKPSEIARNDLQTRAGNEHVPSALYYELSIAPVTPPNDGSEKYSCYFW